jgi:hypothetical protein
LSSTGPISFDVRNHFQVARDLLLETRDLLIGQADSLSVDWALARGWADYLRALSDEALTSADTLGISRCFVADADCPTSLRDLAARVEAFCVLPRWKAPQDPAVNWSSTHARKRQRIAAVRHALGAFYPRFSQLVDMGAGRGQRTTRAARALLVTALGLEMDPERVEVVSKSGPEVTKVALPLTRKPVPAPFSPRTLLLPNGMQEEPLLGMSGSRPRVDRRLRVRYCP